MAIQSNRCSKARPYQTVDRCVRRIIDIQVTVQTFWIASEPDQRLCFINRIVAIPVHNHHHDVPFGVDMAPWKFD